MTEGFGAGNGNDEGSEWCNNKAVHIRRELHATVTQQLSNLVSPVVPSVSMCKEEALDPICTIVFPASSDS